MRPPALPRSVLRLTLTTVLIAATLAGPASPARAGTYTVSGTCDGWQAWSGSPTIRPYAQAGFGGYPCPSLIASAEQTSSPGSAAGWTFYAPAGTSVVDAAFEAYARAGGGWQAAIYRLGGGASGSSWLNCPGGDGCAANPGNNWVHAPGYNADAVVIHLMCRSANPCPDQNWIEVGGNASVALEDNSAPAVSLGGDGARSGWKHGNPTIVVNATDNTGIQRTVLFIDGNQLGAIDHGCNFAAAVPCANTSDEMRMALAGLPDGEHRVAAHAADAAGNVGGAEQPVLVDNTAPAPPQNVAISGGAGWQADKTRRISWTNPAQEFAPIAAIRYTLCPVEADSTDRQIASTARKSCVEDTKSEDNVSALPALELPKPGLYTLKAFLVDSAGNANPENAVRIDNLGYDPTPPTVAGIAPPDANDPARVTVQAGDDLSGLAGGAVEVRRHGQEVWRPLATEAHADGVSAVVDDEKLKRGLYDVRATVTNRAGLQQGTDHRTDGSPAVLKLPIRLGSRLRAGKPGRTCHRRAGKRRCHAVLRTRPGVGVSRTVKLLGRLTSRGQPIGDQPLELWQRLKFPGAAWQRIGSVTTGARGGFTYTAGAGPARRLRFRYPGTPYVRGDNAGVQLRVKARTSARASRRTVINGEYVTFSGRLQGGWLPNNGVLVELQVRSRGQWRTFAQPRAAKDGRWEYQYRFETVAGHARYRFRARVRRQAGFPFETGSSRTFAVTVRGL
jgi:hypothetical protein